MKVLVWSVALVTMSFNFAAALDATSLGAAVEGASVSSICCLPVLEETTKGMLGYCYEAEDGYLQARIGDDRLRNHANLHSREYPVCKDTWCSFAKGPKEKRYYRTNKQGFVLQQKDQKFPQDHVGFLDDVSTQHIANYGLTWIGGTIPTCQVAVDVNAELLSPLCVMKAEEDHKLSFVTNAQVKQALYGLSSGKKEYVLFYKAEAPSSTVTGQVPQKYLRALFDSKARIKVGACSSNSFNKDFFAGLGFEIVE